MCVVPSRYGLMQYLPFCDQAAIDTLIGFEQLVYQSLN
jgi:hypothetical protein